MCVSVRVAYMAFEFRSLPVCFMTIVNAVFEG
jgi:hypothetical protein